MERDATGKITRAVNTAHSGWRSPAIRSRNSNTSNAYRKRFPPEHNIQCNAYHQYPATPCIYYATCSCSLLSLQMYLPLWIKKPVTW